MDTPTRALTASLGYVSAVAWGTPPLDLDSQGVVNGRVALISCYGFCQCEDMKIETRMRTHQSRDVLSRPCLWPVRGECGVGFECERQIVFSV